MRRPILLAFSSVNHMFPSGPVMFPRGPEWGVGTGYSVIVPDVVVRAILFVSCSVNHRFPSGPGVMK